MELTVTQQSLALVTALAKCARYLSVQQSLLTWSCSVPIIWICPRPGVLMTMSLFAITLYCIMNSFVARYLHPFCYVSLGGGPLTDAKSLESGLNHWLLTLFWCMAISLGGMPMSCPSLSGFLSARGCEVCHLLQPVTLLYLACPRRGCVGVSTLWTLPCVGAQLLSAWWFLLVEGLRSSGLSVEIYSLRWTRCPLDWAAPFAGPWPALESLWWALYASGLSTWSLWLRWWRMSWWLGLGLLRGICEIFHWLCTAEFLRRTAV